MTEGQHPPESQAVPEALEEQTASAEAADVEALHAEVADLRRKVAENQEKGQAAKHTGRRWVVGLLILLGCILLAGGNTALWVRDVVLDTDTWVSTVGPLSRSEVVAGTLSVYVVGEIFDAVDVEAVAKEALPAEFAVLSGPLVGVLQDLAGDTVTQLIQSDQFNAVWVTANRAAHAVAMEALRGNQSLLYLEDGALTFDLSDVFSSLENSLGLERLGLFAGEETPGKIVLFTNQQVALVQQVLAVIDAVGTLLPLLALVSFVIAWLVSLWRRQTLMWIGIGVLVTAALSLVVLAFAQPVALSMILDPLFRALADEVWDVILNGLIWQTVLLGVLGLLVALGAWVFGPSENAVGIRTEVGGWFGRTSA